MPRRAQTTLSYLDAPLDEVLGQVSHVRILRALTAHVHPVPPSELARDTRLDLSGVVRALDRLTQLGIVRALGVGRGRVMEFNRTHHLAPMLDTLFEGERQQRQVRVDALRQLMSKAVPSPRAAWIEGPHASGTDTAQDTLRLGVLTTVRERQALTTHLTAALQDFERRFDVAVELLVRTRADLETLPDAQITAIRNGQLLYGVPPFPSPGSAKDDAPATQATTHAELDRRSLLAAEGVARAITRDPRLVERAQRWVEHRLGQASEAERHELREWAHILTLSPHRISAILRDPGERATRLRQTSPFVAILDHAPSQRTRP